MLTGARFEPMVNRSPDEQRKNAADSLRKLRRQTENGSARMKSAERKLNRLASFRGSSPSKSAAQVTSSLDETSTARNRLLAELGNLASALESGKDREIQTAKKQFQQSHKILADAVKRLDRSIKSRERERAPSDGAGDGAKPDIDQLLREIYEAVLRELESLSKTHEDPWL